MIDWNDFIESVYNEIKRLQRDSCVLPFFRGHNNSEWKLTPLIYRDHPDFDNAKTFDNTAFTEFQANCGQLYNRPLSDWEILCEMRHSGLPTRLLDWTENFAAALYFALDGVDWKKNSDKENPIRPCIWIMNPFKLNESCYKEGAIPTIHSLPFSYEDILGMNTKKFMDKISGPVAIIPPREQKRIFAQKCVYTLHAFDYGPIEKKYEDSVKKFEIPLSAIDEANTFLFLCGMNDYSLFPDLDGLGSYIRKKHSHIL
jgi:hypothetical protein